MRRQPFLFVIDCVTHRQRQHARRLPAAGWRC